MSTASIVARNQAIVTQIRDYTDPDGRSVGEICGDGVYIGQAPDGQTGTYVVLRFENAETDPEYNNARVEFDLEATVVTRPRAKEMEADLVAQLAEQALLTYRVASSELGLLFFTKSQASSEPLIEVPEDRDIVAKSVIIHGVMWPRYLTAVLT